LPEIIDDTVGAVDIGQKKTKAFHKASPSRIGAA
jgi:hypothetical protein